MSECRESLNCELTVAFLRPPLRLRLMRRPMPLPPGPWPVSLRAMCSNKSYTKSDLQAERWGVVGSGEELWGVVESGGEGWGALSAAFVNLPRNPHTIAPPLPVTLPCLPAHLLSLSILRMSSRKVSRFFSSSPSTS